MKMNKAKGHSRWIAVAILSALAAGSGPALADVAFVIDKSTLNDLLTALVGDRVEVPLGADAPMTVLFEDLKITALDPSAGGKRQGYILTTLKLRVPDIGLALTVKPRISLDVVERASGSMLELRFEELLLPIPLAGSVDVALLIPPIRYNTDNVWLLAGARGDVPVNSSLKEIAMGREAIRFLFDVEVLP